MRLGAPPNQYIIYRGLRKYANLVFIAREEFDIFHHHVGIGQRQYFRVGGFCLDGEDVGVQVLDDAVHPFKPVSATIYQKFQLDTFQIFDTLHGVG